MSKPEFKAVPEEPKPTVASTNGGGGGGSVGERLARLEELAKHLATKAEIEKLKYWMIIQTYVVIVQVIGIGFILWRVFSG